MMAERPTTSNADAWLLFLSENTPEYACIQIAEAIEEAEDRGCERRIDKMGWPEIHAFYGELYKGQDIYEDAGGFFLRALRRLFGLKKRETVTTYKEAAQAMLHAEDE